MLSFVSVFSQFASDEWQAHVIIVYFVYVTLSMEWIALNFPNRRLKSLCVVNQRIDRRDWVKQKTYWFFAFQAKANWPIVHEFELRWLWTTPILRIWNESHFTDFSLFIGFNTPREKLENLHTNNHDLYSRLVHSFHSLQLKFSVDSVLLTA